MASITPTSRAELSQRRKQLRRQRRVQQFQAFGRFMIVAGIAAGAIWTVRQPIWVLRQAEQVKIEGNQYLSEQTIRKLVPITYPQSIFRTQPQQIVTTLKEKAPLTSVTVERQLFPPALVVRVQEQTPVATVYSQAVHSQAVYSQTVYSQAGKVAPIGTAPAPKSNDTADALLDEQGNVIPLETYTGLEHNIQLPALKVFGNPEQYRQKWRDFYQTIKTSPIPIQQVDWRNPSNLILGTELASVHFGLYGAKFRQQLRAMDGLRTIVQRVPKHQIDYIDLRNPHAPAVQKKVGAKAIEPTAAPPAETFDRP
jgi:cell division protein FtsQ